MDGESSASMASGMNAIIASGPGFDINVTFTTSQYGLRVDGYVHWTDDQGPHEYLYENEEIYGPLSLDLPISYVSEEGTYFSINYSVYSAAHSNGGNSAPSATASASLGIDLTATAP